MPDLMFTPTQYEKRQPIRPVSEGGEIFSFGDTVRGIGAGAEGFGRSVVGLADWATGGDLIDDRYSQERWIDRPTTLVGGLAEGITQFSIGFFASGLGWAAKASQIGKGAYALQQAARSVITDFAAFDGHDGRLSNLLQSFPELKNPVLDYLAADPDDGQGEGRAKNVLEGVLVDLGLKGVGKVFGAALGGYKRGMRLIEKLGDTDVNTGIIAEKFREAAYSGVEGEGARLGVLEAYAESAGVKVADDTAQDLSPEVFRELRAQNDTYLAGAVQDIRSNPPVVDSDIPVVRSLQIAGRNAAKALKGALDIFTPKELKQAVESGALSPIPAGDIKAVETFVKSVGPPLFKDLDLFVGHGESDSAVRGSYDARWKVVNIATEAIRTGSVASTTIHELWHSLEQVLQPEEVVRVKHEFMNDRRAFIDAKEIGWEAVQNGRKIDVADFPPELDAVGAQAAFERAYSMTNPSEWFAVNLTNRTLAQKHADDPVFAFGRDWLAGLARGFATKYGGDAAEELFEKFISGKAVGGRVRQDRLLVGRLGRDGAKDLLNSEGISAGMSGPERIRKALDNLEDIRKKVDAISGEDVIDETGRAAAAGDVVRSNRAMEGLIDGYSDGVVPLNLTFTHQNSDDVAAEITRAAEQMGARDSTEAIVATRRVMNDAEAAAAKASAEWLADATNTNSITGLFGAFEGLAKESHAAGMKFFHTLHLSRAVMVSQAKRVAKVLQEIQPRVLDKSASDKEIATVLRMTESFASTVQGVRKTMYIAGKTLQSAQRAADPRTLAKVRKALKEGKLPEGAVKTPEAAAPVGELPLAGEAVVGKPADGLQAPDVPAGELPLSGEAAVGKPTDGLQASPVPVQRELPLSGEAGAAKPADGLGGPSGPAAGELPFEPARSQEDLGKIETYDTGGPKDPRFAKAKAAAQQAQSKIDELAQELGIDDKSAQAIIQRFGGRKKALAIFDAVSRFSDNPDALQRMLGHVDAHNKDLLTQVNFDLAKFARVAEREAGKRSWSDAWVEWYMNSLLSGPKTLVTNGFSGAVATLWRPMELALGGDKHRFKLPMIYMTGMIDSFSDAMRAAKQAFKDEAPVLLRDAENAIEGTRAAAISAAGRGVRADTAKGRAIDFIGRLIRLPSATLTATDEFWKQMAYRGEAKIATFRQAVEQGKPVAVAKAEADAAVKKLIDPKGRAPTYQRFLAEAQEEISKLPEAQGLDPADLQIAVKDRANEMHREFRDSGMERVATDAQNWAMEATLTTPLDDSTFLGTLGRKLQDVNSAYPMMRLFLPFIRTPLNILSFASHRLDVLGPTLEVVNKGLKLFGSEIPETSRLWTRFNRDLAEGGAKRADAIGRLTFGLSAATTIGMFAAQGMITGTGPKDPHQRAALLATGWQPYSVKVGGTYYSYSRLDPLATAVGVLADIVDVTGKVEEDLVSTEYLHGAMSGIIAGFTNNMTERSYLVGLATLLDAVQDPEGRAVQALQRIGAGAVVPSFVNQTANAGDPHMREMRGFLDELRNRVGADLPVKRDALGEPVRRRTSVGDSTFTNAVVPIEASEERGDPVRSEMARLKHGFRPPKPEYGGVDLLSVKHGGGTAFAAWQERIGQVRSGGKTLQASLAKLLGSREYKALPDSVDGSSGLDSPKVAAINSVIGKYRREAFASLLKDSPELRAAYTSVQSARKKLR